MYDIQQNGLDKQENNNNNHNCTQTQNVTYLCCDQFGPHSTIDFTRVGRFNENCFSRISRVGDQYGYIRKVAHLFTQAQSQELHFCLLVAGKVL